MPITALKNIAKKNKISVGKAEKQFKEVAKSAKSEGYNKPYAVAMAAVKKNKKK